MEGLSSSLSLDSESEVSEAAEDELSTSDSKLSEYSLSDEEANVTSEIAELSADGFSSSLSARISFDSTGAGAAEYAFLRER